uniref:Helicase ATP-binding domain-containing protein n=1 Tax=Populus alba TaxID=43335 RepID=A0A4U5NQ09_POPAL|nr:hypothetical protein D5086_0000251000 [Populus alba]
MVAASSWAEFGWREEGEPWGAPVKKKKRKAEEGGPVRRNNSNPGEATLVLSPRVPVIISKLCPASTPSLFNQKQTTTLKIVIESLDLLVSIPKTTDKDNLNLLRSYAREPKNIQDRESADLTPFDAKLPGNKLMETEISVHPKHRKKMKAHQVEVFKFLCSNLLADDPGGCILAHAPGSGKTFMVISFIKSFPAKNPDGRPLVVMPKGILATWKKEFATWQAEDIPLIDFYSSKADKRSQQLDVLEQWVKQRSILFLGYKQFSVTVSDNVSNKVAADCKDVLLKVPTLLILDDGHLPRNEEIEVFNILNLVRPKFLKFKTCREIVNRIMIRVQIPKMRSHTGTDSAFFDLVEYTLQNDEDLRTRKAVIQNLRGSNAGNMERFNGSPDAKVFFGSIKACGEGISLVGASRIIISDVHPKPPVTRQAIGRAFRPGREKKVYAYRLVTSDSPEEQDCLSCCKKELTS